MYDLWQYYGGSCLESASQRQQSVSHRLVAARARHVRVHVLSFIHSSLLYHAH